MEISQRAAQRILFDAGLERPPALRVLRAGLAGPGRAVGGNDQRPGKVLYDEDKVRDLLTWTTLPFVGPETSLEPAAFVLRPGPRRPDSKSNVGWTGIDLSAPGEEQRNAIAMVPRLSFWALACYVVTRQAHGPVPLLATVSGFVAFGAEVDSILAAPGRSHLLLRQPGEWFEAFQKRRILAGRGDRRLWLGLEASERARRDPETLVKVTLVTP